MAAEPHGKRFEMTKKIKTIIGRQIRLEPFRGEFITERYAGWLRDELVNRYLYTGNPDVTLEDIKAYINKIEKQENEFFMAIIHNDTGLHIGNLRFEISDTKAGIGRFGTIVGDTAFHGRGIGTEAVKLILDTAFNEFKLNKIFLDVVKSNIAAVRIYEKNGFIVEGCMRNHFFKNNRFEDVLIMSVFNPKNQGVE
jgi:RimJ/RimL family protein N-acetyltransferase